MDVVYLFNSTEVSLSQCCINCKHILETFAPIFRLSTGTRLKTSCPCPGLPPRPSSSTHPSFPHAEYESCQKQHHLTVYLMYDIDSGLLINKLSSKGSIPSFRGCLLVGVCCRLVCISNHVCLFAVSWPPMDKVVTGETTVAVYLFLLFS